MEKTNIESLIWLLFIFLFGVFGLLYAVRMPGKSHRGSLPELTTMEIEIQEHLKKHVEYLSVTIGERHIKLYKNLLAAQKYIENVLQELGYEVTRHIYQIQEKEFCNIEIKIEGTEFQDEIIVIGAHYDSVQGTPGADDNASGVAALLELAKLLKEQKLKRSIYLVAFPNEEFPFFWRHDMGSYQYARKLKQNHANVVAMFSLESIGFFSDTKKSQKYPLLLNLFYPDQGNFIAFVANLHSRTLVREVIKLFRASTAFPSEGISAPVWVPGIAWSDQVNFWHFRYPAVMVTDTVPFRNPHYHASSDLPETLDYERMSRVVNGLFSVILQLSNR